MMTLPERFQRAQQLEPVAAYRPVGMDDPRNFKYFADVPAGSMGVHQQLPGFGPPPMGGLGMGPPPPSLYVPRAPPLPKMPVAPAAPPPPKGSPTAEAAVSEEFSNLSLKRVSKALKLISPTTNTPIQPAEEQRASCANSDGSSESDKDSCARSRNGDDGSFARSKTMVSEGNGLSASLKSPPEELPTGSRLRQWITCEPGSPEKTAESSSAASVSSEFSPEKSISMKDSVHELEGCGSEDSTAISVEQDLMGVGSVTGGDVPRRSKLWIWMSKDEN